MGGSDGRSREGCHTDLCPWLSREGPARTLHVVLPSRLVAVDRRGCTTDSDRSDEWVPVDIAAGTSLRTYRQTELDPRSPAEDVRT